ncbi:hypothetical protein P3T23_008500 [Paraburkholderia sp. GAS448]
MNAGMAVVGRTAESAAIRMIQRKAAVLEPRRAVARVVRIGAIVAFGAGAALRIGQVSAQDASMLNEQVTQQSVADTICRPGYADTVSPPLDEMMDYKERLLAQHGIDSAEGTRYALDRRVPIVLGGSPDAPANLGLLPWAGHRGERRKELLTAKLKRCVCVGQITLSEAQATIAGDWPAVYSRFSRTSCDAGGAEPEASGNDNGS